MIEKKEKPLIEKKSQEVMSDLKLQTNKLQNTVLSSGSTVIESQSAIILLMIEIKIKRK